MEENEPTNTEKDFNVGNESFKEMDIIQYVGTCFILIFMVGFPLGIIVIRKITRFLEQRVKEEKE